MEDFHRAGGVFGVLGELARAQLLHTELPMIHSASLDEALKRWDVQLCDDENLSKFYRAGPAGIPTQRAFSQDTRWDDLDLDRAGGCIRDLEHAYSADGGLAVLYGNIAERGCVVKTAGVADALLVFEGPAHVVESQEEAVEHILESRLKPGEIMIVRYEGPQGGPGMQEMLYPTSHIKSMGLGEKCALVTDGRFSGGTSGLCIGHVSPEAAGGGAIALIRDGDMIRIDIPARRIDILIGDDELKDRRDAMENTRTPWQPSRARPRKVSEALRIYARFASSADVGAVRKIDD